MGGGSKTKHESIRALKTGLCQAFHISETESPTELGFTLTKIKNEPTALDHTQDQGCWRVQLRGNQSGSYSPDSNTAKETTVWSTNIYFLLLSQALCWALEMNKLDVAPALMELIYSLREEVE